MPKGFPKNGENKGWITKGQRIGLATEFKKGKRNSLSTEFKKGVINYVPFFTKGFTPWNKGKKMSLGYRKKVSRAVIKNYKEHPEIIDKIRKARLRQILPVKDT